MGTLKSLIVTKMVVLIGPRCDHKVRVVDRSEWV